MMLKSLAPVFLTLAFSGGALAVVVSILSSLGESERARISGRRAVPPASPVRDLTDDLDTAGEAEEPQSSAVSSASVPVEDKSGNSATVADGSRKRTNRRRREKRKREGERQRQGKRKDRVKDAAGQAGS